MLPLVEANVICYLDDNIRGLMGYILINGFPGTAEYAQNMNTFSFSGIKIETLSICINYLFLV